MKKVILFLLLTSIAAEADPLDQWDRAPLLVASTLNDVMFDNDQFIAVGERGKIFASPDGLEWTNRVSGHEETIYGITHGLDQFVAVGGQTISYSTDGESWSRRVLGTTDSLVSVAFGKDTFVAVGSGGAIWTSADLVNWVPRKSGTNTAINSVKFLNGFFVAVGYFDGVLISQDAVTWKTVVFEPGSLGTWHDIEYGNGLFVAIGVGGAIATSADLESWTNQPAFRGVTFRSVRFGDGIFTMAGDAVNPGLVWTSANGLYWTGRITNVPSSMKKICYAGGRFVVVGDNGTILRSGLQNSSRGQASLALNWYAGLTIEGVTGRNYSIESTEEPVGGVWSKIASVDLKSSPIFWIDPNSATRVKRFYRIAN